MVAAVGIRYGKFCGVGWSGCEGEEPCDDLDACYGAPDHYIDKKGTYSLPYALHKEWHLNSALVQPLHCLYM